MEPSVVVVLSLLLCSEQVLSIKAHGIIDPYKNSPRGEEAYYDLDQWITMDGDQKVGRLPVKRDEATGIPYGTWRIGNANRDNSLAQTGMNRLNMDTANSKLAKRPFSSLGPSGRLGERRRRAEYFLNHLARMNK